AAQPPRARIRTRATRAAKTFLIKTLSFRRCRHQGGAGLFESGHPYSGSFLSFSCQGQKKQRKRQNFFIFLCRIPPTKVRGILHKTQSCLMASRAEMRTARLAGRKP